MSRLVLLLSITLTAAGCALGPRYQRPDVAVPDDVPRRTGDRRERRLARRPPVVRAVRRSRADRARHDGAAAELRSAHRRRARAAGPGRLPHPAQRSVPGDRRLRRRRDQRRVARRRHADPGRRGPRRHLRPGRRRLQLGAGRVGPPAQPRGVVAGAVSRHRGSAARGRHDPDRRRDGALPRAPLARSRARHRPPHRRRRDGGPAADAGAAGARRRHEPRRAAGRAAALHRPRPGGGRRTRHRPGGTRAQPAARPRSRRRSIAAAPSRR